MCLSTKAQMLPIWFLIQSLIYPSNGHAQGFNTSLASKY